MSGNDQPPCPPPPGGPGGPDRLGAPFGQPKKRTGLVIGIAAAVVLLLAGGGVGAYFLVSNSDDDKSGEASVRPLDDWCASVQATYDIPKSETDEEPSKVSDALREAGVPENFPDDAQAGLDELIEIGDEAENGEEAKQQADERSTPGSDLAALYGYISENCPELQTQETVSVEEHCAAMDEAYQLIGDEPSGDPQEFADAIEAAGITEDMTEDQLAGREIVIRVIGDASSYDELDTVDEDFTEEETRQTGAFFEYYADHCTDLATSESPAPSETESLTPTP